ncbi:MFS-type transporter C16A3.17c 1 [Botrytis cinerea]
MVTSKLPNWATIKPYFTSEQESAILLKSQARNSEGRGGGKSEPQAGISYAEPCSLCMQEKKAFRRYRWRVIAGLMLPYMVQALDITIIAGALPFIASDFNQLSQLNWIISAFNLTATAFIPAWGQLADIVGRYATLQAALIFTLIGSALCAGAPVSAFTMLLFGRALQGLGCSGLLILTKVILADKVSLKENAKNNSVFAIVGGLAYGFGPIVGGELTQVSWRWCFIINIPIALVGMVGVHFLLRPIMLGPQTIRRTDDNTEMEGRQTFITRLSTLDFGGQFLFLFGMGLFILAITWAGAYYPWSDAKVIVPLVLGSLLVILFLVWEYLMMPGSALALRYPYRRAMLPFNLILSRNSGLLMYINFITGMAMYAVFYFVDIYFALVLQFSSSEGGKNLLYYIPGLAVGVYLAISLLGHLPTIYGMLALTGVGTGIRLMPGTLHAIGHYPTQIAPLVSMMSLSSSLGGTLALTIMLNIFNNHLSSSGISVSGTTTASFSGIATLESAEQDYVRKMAKEGIVLAFYAISAFLWLGVGASAALGNAWIAKGGGEEVGRTCEGSFLGSLLSRKRRSNAEKA